MMQIQIDGETVSEHTFGTDRSAAFFVTNEDISADRIRVVFTNDLYEPDKDVDRNLTVVALQVIDRATDDRTRVNPDDEDVFSTGTWTDGDGFVDGFARGDTLHKNGYFQLVSDDTPVEGNAGVVGVVDPGNQSTFADVGNFTFTAVRTEGTEGAVSFDWAAVQGGDNEIVLTPSTGTVELADGESTKEFTVFFADSVSTGLFTINLTNATGGLAIHPVSNTVTVAVDARPVVEVA